MQQGKGLLSLSVLAVALCSSAYAYANQMGQANVFEASTPTTYYHAHQGEEDSLNLGPDKNGIPQSFSSAPELVSVNHEPQHAESKMMPSKVAISTQQKPLTLSEMTKNSKAFDGYVENFVINHFSDMPAVIGYENTIDKNIQNFLRANPYDKASKAVQAEETDFAIEYKTVSDDEASLNVQWNFDVEEYENAHKPSIWDDIGHAFSDAFNAVTSEVSDVVSLTNDAVNDMTGGLSGDIENDVSSAVTTVSGLAGDVVNDVTDGLQSDVSSFLHGEVSGALSDVGLRGTAIGNDISSAVNAPVDVSPVQK